MKSNGDENMWKWIVLGGLILAAGAVCTSRRKKQNTSITFDEYINELSRKSDQYARKQMKKESSQKVVGGKCEIKISDEDPSVVQAILKIYKNGGKESGWIVSELDIARSIHDFSKDDETQSKLRSIHSEPLILDLELPQI